MVYDLYCNSLQYTCTVFNEVCVQNVYTVNVVGQVQEVGEQQQHHPAPVRPRLHAGAGTIRELSGR